jgi:glucokinase
MGEMTYGAARGMKNFIMITLGTGVGSGIVVDGKVVYGHDGFAGELGHTCAVRGEAGRPCNCGKKGCLEAYASATGVARTAKEIISSTTQDTLLRNLDIDAITSKDVFDAAEQGDEVAKQIFDYTGTILGQQLADFIAFSAPEAIVMFGGLTKSGHWILDPVVKAMNENVLPLWRNKVQVLFSDLKEADAAVLGASALAWGD